MAYYPTTDEDRVQMLAAIGVNSVDELFTHVPEQHRFPKLDIPPALSEMDIMRELSYASSANHTVADNYAMFLGAGAYHHFIPSIVNHMLLRGEFLTAYTPYQPEVSQGTLQSIYEFQSMICAVTGMEAANASHYDGGTAMAEAVTMAAELKRNRNKVVLSPSVHPQYRDVAQTYHQHRDIKFVGHRGNASIPDLVDMVDKQTLMVIVQYPDFYGKIQDFTEIAKACKANDALFCVVTDPIACGLLKSPGELGADIVVGEGQSLGIPMSFGGPYLGFFATKMRYVRKIAGRVVGETKDGDGRRAFVMTLRPREQDIRREKATSNICTNQGLMALAAGIYMSALGKNGMRKVAELCWHKSHYAADEIDKLDGYVVDREKPFFKEFVVTCPKPAAELNQKLVGDFGIIGGYDLGQVDPKRANDMLLCVTEMNTKSEIDALAAALKAISE